MASKFSSSSAANGLDPGHEYDFSDSEDKNDVYKYNEQESDEGEQINLEQFFCLFVFFLITAFIISLLLIRPWELKL